MIRVKEGTTIVASIRNDLDAAADRPRVCARVTVRRARL